MVHPKTLFFKFSHFQQDYTVTLSFRHTLVLVITRSPFTSEILNSNFPFSDRFFFPFHLLFPVPSISTLQFIPLVLLMHQSLLVFAQINILPQIWWSIYWKYFYYLSALFLSFCQTHLAKLQTLDEYEYLSLFVPVPRILSLCAKLFI